jgi:DNA repair protein RadC
MLKFGNFDEARIFVAKKLKEKLKARECVKFEDQSHFVEFVRSTIDFSQERAFFFFLDNDFHLLEAYEVDQGDEKSVVFCFKTIYKNALKCGASQVLITHTHMNSDYMFSIEDIHMARELVMGFMINKINVVDFMVITADNFSSMKKDKTLDTLKMICSDMLKDFINKT